MREQVFVAGRGPTAAVLVADDAEHAAEAYCEQRRMVPAGDAPTARRLVCVEVRALVADTQEWGPPVVYTVTVRRDTTYSARASSLAILPADDITAYAGAHS